METTPRSEDERETLARLLGDELGWDWAGVPAEHIPSAREVLLDLADALIAAGYRNALNFTWGVDCGRTAPSEWCFYQEPHEHGFACDHSCPCRTNEARWRNPPVGEGEQ